MEHYIKTDLGIQALQQRSFQLNARQRQLLLLIGTDDFKILNSGLKQRLATPELIQQLEDLGLIFQNQTHQANPITIESTQRQQSPVQIIDTKNSNQKLESKNKEYPTEITSQQDSKESSTSNIQVSEKLIENVQAKPILENVVETVESIQPERISLSFNEIQQTMSNLLQTHCGLMAKQLIVKIQQATSVRELKLCQMQWITALQESRISPILLNQTMQQINYSLQHLQSS